MNSLKNWLLTNKWLILGSIFVIAVDYFYLNKVFAFHFVDEEDNFILGHFLLQGQKLYSDLFSHHQPLGYVMSAAFQFILNPQNIEMLIKRHREFMIIWSVLWSLILIWRFRERVIAPLIIYEPSKFFLLGSLFLSESLAVYPILYLILFLLETRKPKNFEFFIAGFLISLSAFLLAPAWPMLAIYFLFLIWIKKLRVKEFVWLLGGGAIPLLIALPFVDIYYYFRNVFYINFKYYIPQSGEEKMPMSVIKALLSPLTAVINPSSIESSGMIQKVSAVFFLITCVWLLKLKQYRNLILVLTLLTLSNIRYVTPGKEYYTGFHLLIWYAVFLFLSFYFIPYLLNKIKNKSLKYTLIVLVIAAVVTSLYSSKQLFKKNDMAHDYYVNYSELYAYGEAIRAMRSESDTLFVIPDQWLLYFQGDVKNNNKMVNFYGWMQLVWELNDPVVEKFKTDPPTFFFCDCEAKQVETYSIDYTQMTRNGSKTKLWVLNSKYNSLTDSQKDKLRFFDFQF